MGQAVTLARWIGTGRRPVTPGRVLRKADVPAAGAALGVEVPTRLRTMADIRELNRPWCVAVATGLLEVGEGWVTEILAAAESMSPLRRSVAIGLVEALGDDALPAWRDVVSARCIGPFARAVLAAWDNGPEPGEADGDWLGVEGAAAALEDKGPDEALSRVCAGGGPG